MPDAVVGVWGGDLRHFRPAPHVLPAGDFSGGNDSRFTDKKNPEVDIYVGIRDI